MSDVIHNLVWEGEKTPAQILDSIEASEVEEMIITVRTKDGFRYYESTSTTVDKLITMLEKTKFDILIQEHLSE